VSFTPLRYSDEVIDISLCSAWSGPGRFGFAVFWTIYAMESRAPSFFTLWGRAN
jgi:hypothetical protein